MPISPRALRLAPLALLAITTTLGVAIAVAGPTPKMPGPAPRSRAFDAAVENARCERCHADVAAEQRASFHAAAHTDPVYRRALAREPLAFCRGCHAPEERAELNDTTAKAALGVACVTCHVTGALGEGVLAAPLAEGESPGKAPHAVLRDAAFAGDGACGHCHEFAFPGAASRKSVLLMQSTMSEHARADERDATCASCHMPAVSGRARGRHHGFRGGHDEAFVRGAVTIQIDRTGPLSARVILAPKHVGHAFPTGDLFRRLEVSAEAVGPDASLVTSRTRYLTRHFKDQRGPFGGTRVLASDDRLERGQASIELVLDEEARGWPLAVRVAYQRVEHPRDDDDTAEVAGEIELAVRILPP